MAARGPRTPPIGPTALSHDAAGRPLRHGVSALWVLAAAVLFSLMAALIRKMSLEGLPAVQVAHGRTWIAFLPLLVYLLVWDRTAWRTDQPLGMVTRAGFTSVAQLLTVVAFALLPLALANAVSFSRPLFVALLAVLFLGERVGPRRTIALALGFVGVIVVIHPFDAFSGDLPKGFLTGVAVAVAASAIFAGSIILVRSMTASNRPITLIFWALALPSVFLAPFALWVWEPMSASQWLDMTLMSLLGSGAQYCYIRGLSEGEASMAGMIDYTRLIFTAILGYVFFSETPGVWTYVGAAIIVASTLYVTLREAYLRRQAGG